MAVLLVSTEGSGRPRGAGATQVVAALSNRGSASINRRAYGDEAAARGAVGRCPGRYGTASGGRFRLISRCAVRLGVTGSATESQRLSAGLAQQRRWSSLYPTVEAFRSIVALAVTQRLSVGADRRWPGGPPGLVPGRGRPRPNRKGRPGRPERPLNSVCRAYAARETRTSSTLRAASTSSAPETAATSRVRRSSAASYS